ncbi:uncharacterized protein LOC143854537 isoform X2 [Tasmannia lanceolata]
MLWSGETPNVSELEENMEVYSNMLQGFLLLCHGSIVGAGPTLHAKIRTSAKQVTDCSLSLLREAVNSYGYRTADRKLSISQLAGSVWEACSALKKTPTTNYTAIGRAITQVAVSVKDVLREMSELKPAPSVPRDDDGSSEDDVGTDLSPEEMTIAQSAIGVISDTLLVIKELIRFITGLLKQSNYPNECDAVDTLERLLEICRGIGVQVDELGACIYPPQEVSLMKATTEKLSGGVNRLHAEIQSLDGSAEGFFKVCDGVDASLRKLESELGCFDTSLEGEMQSLAVRM